MVTLVPVSNTPLIFDALPAAKVRYYYGSYGCYGSPARGNIYTLARMYFLQGSLALSLSAFERDPDEMSRIEFALAGSQDAPLFRIVLTRGGIQSVHPVGATGAVGPSSSFSGADEQGWYWGAHLTIPPDILEEAGLVPAPEVEFRAALYKTRAGEDAYGSSFQPGDPQNPHHAADFGLFRIVSY